MKLTARSLFLKIFLWFWATVIVTGIALILTFFLGPHSIPARWHASLTDAARSSGMIAVAEYERRGAPAATAYIEKLEQDTGLRVCLFEQDGSPVAGHDCGTFASMVTPVAASHTPVFTMKYGIARVALMLPGSGSREYIFATELPAGPRAAIGMNVAAFILRWGVAFLVSGFVCYLLTLYITTPILRLREASQQLACGNLGIRAAQNIERRGDELGALVRDFNTMADRIQELISSQRQLIYDISHELRSPLARLNVALDLGRKKKDTDAAFDRMERDLGRLNEMIERVLTIARLDTSTLPPQMASLNLTDLVSQIICDAGFEAQERGIAVTLHTHQEYSIAGNAELLHSAIENAVRNAIRYAKTKTQVDLISNKTWVSLVIADDGPGVPESELENIFQPFYRVANARDRQSGGAGLGLAIADRVIKIHGGSIAASNANPQGLQIEMRLPLA